MSGKTDAQGRGNFFSVDLRRVDDILDSHLGWNCAVCYLVLAYGVNRKSVHYDEGNNEFPSSHGLTSIKKYGGVEKAAAQKAIEELCARGFIRKATYEEGRPGQRGKRAPTAPKEKGPSYFVRLDGQLLLPKELIEGLRVPNAPAAPLKRIDSASGRAVKATLLRLLLHLYANTDLGEHGGVDPRKVWRKIENATTLSDEHERPLGGGYVMREIALGGVFFQRAFMNATTGHLSAVDEEARRKAFSDVLDWLLHQGLVYWITAIWDADPCGPGGEFAQPLYTLAIHSKHASVDEPYLARDLHRVATKNGALDAHEQFKALGEEVLRGDRVQDDDSSDILGSGRWRYAIEEDGEGFPVGVLRPLHRPKTNDTGVGLAAERDRVEEWRDRLDPRR